jgi:hypothetical protein
MIQQMDKTLHKNLIQKRGTQIFVMRHKVISPVTQRARRISPYQQTPRITDAPNATNAAASNVRTCLHKLQTQQQFKAWQQVNVKILKRVAGARCRARRRVLVKPDIVGRMENAHPSLDVYLNARLYCRTGSRRTSES